MYTLHTKDGSKFGNAIVFKVEYDPFGHALHHIETDFGNMMKLSDREVDEMYTVGELIDYPTWLDERARIRLHH
jgi:hypothetical protein